MSTPSTDLTPVERLHAALREVRDFLMQPVDALGSAEAHQPLADRLGLIGGVRTMAIVTEALSAYEAVRPPWWELVDPGLVEEHVRLTRDTRHAQQLFKKTGDPILWRELPRLEEQLDDLSTRLHAAIAAAKPDPRMVVKGGAL